MKQLAAPWHTEEPPQNWATPTSLFVELSRCYGPFDIDVAAEDDNTKCSRYLTVDDDALDSNTSWSPWGIPGHDRTVAWCNPPYDDIEPWLKKARSEIAKGNVDRVVFLIPVRTSTAWFHEIVQPHAMHTLFLRGRVSFDPPAGVKPSTPFEDSMVVIFARSMVPNELKKKERHYDERNR